MTRNDLQGFVSRKKKVAEECRQCTLYVKKKGKEKNSNIYNFLNSHTYV